MYRFMSDFVRRFRYLQSWLCFSECQKFRLRIRMFTRDPLDFQIMVHTSLKGNRTIWATPAYSEKTQQIDWTTPAKVAKRSNRQRRYQTLFRLFHVLRYCCSLRISDVQNVHGYTLSIIRNIESYPTWDSDMSTNYYHNHNHANKYLKLY